jgi:transposase
MYIRKVTHAHKKNQHEYHTFKLVESVRTERGPRQRMLLNLGTDFTFPEEKWKDLANRIEGIITGQYPLFAYPEEIETLARRYARKIINYQGQLQKSDVSSEGSPGVEEPDYHRVDINTLENEHPRPVGAEYVIHETIKELELDKKLTSLGFNKPALDVAIGVITARLVAPSSERAAHIWLQRMTGIEDLLETDFSDLSQDRVYKVSDMLLRRKTEIEEHLRVKECSLFNLEETILLYDLTNTFFEGTGKYNSKAHFGRSKEKRSDCPLVTLGLVLDADGFPKRSDTFDGNVSEPGTLEGMVHSLSSPDMLRKPLIVVDAGLATAANLQWLKDHRYGYIVVSRKKKTEMPQGLPMVTVREDNQRLIRAALMNNQDTQEIELYCHSTAKEAKEEGIKNRFEKRFEEELKKVRGALSKKRGTKRYEKVVEKIGRLKERFKRVARRYEINVDKEDNTDRAAAITWKRKEESSQCGFYCLRSNQLDFKEQELFDIFSMLTDIEDAFRSMKSELGLRPIYHQKEHRADGHLFITVLAYHILQTIRFKLRQKEITHSWPTIRKELATHARISTTIKGDDGTIIHIRKSSRPEPFHVQIYNALNLTHRAGKTIKTIL